MDHTVECLTTILVAELTRATSAFTRWLLRCMVLSCLGRWEIVLIAHMPLVPTKSCACCWASSASFVVEEILAPTSLQDSRPVSCPPKARGFCLSDTRSSADAGSSSPVPWGCSLGCNVRSSPLLWPLVSADVCSSFSLFCTVHSVFRVGKICRLYRTFPEQRSPYLTLIELVTPSPLSALHK